MTDSHSVIDLVPALARLGEDRELLCDLARFYLQDSPQLLSDLEAGLSGQDAESVARAAHSLKGLSANFDAHLAVDAARSMEQLAMRGQLGLVAERVPELHKEISRVQSALSQLLRDSGDCESR